jgi:hypothetical protein
LKEEHVLSSLLMKWFLRPFISSAVNCGFAVGFPGLKKLSFSRSCHIIRLRRLVDCSFPRRDMLFSHWPR